jgi:putative ATP-dependent endonuclease of OLD family
LCAEEQKVPDELVHILKINQNAIVVIDSDKQYEDDSINATKQRIKEECDRNKGICWVTEGREIENYLSERVISLVCENLTEKQVRFAMQPYGKFEQDLMKALDLVGASPLDYSADKVKYARLFVKHLELSDIGDCLRMHLQEITAKIRYWNE